VFIYVYVRLCVCVCVWTHCLSTACMHHITERGGCHHHSPVHACTGGQAPLLRSAATAAAPSQAAPTASKKTSPLHCAGTCCSWMNLTPKAIADKKNTDSGMGMHRCASVHWMCLCALDVPLCIAAHCSCPWTMCACNITQNLIQFSLPQPPPPSTPPVPQDTEARMMEWVRTYMALPLECPEPLPPAEVLLQDLLDFTQPPVPLPHVRAS